MITIKIFRKIESVFERLSDLASEWSGKPMFLFAHLAGWGVWMLIGIDKYPFGLLTLIVSLEAILLSGLILSSQNRQNAKDANLMRKGFRLDTKTNKTVDEILEEIEELKEILQEKNKNIHQ